MNRTSFLRRSCSFLARYVGEGLRQFGFALWSVPPWPPHDDGDPDTRHPRSRAR